MQDTELEKYILDLKRGTYVSVCVIRVGWSCMSYSFSVAAVDLVMPEQIEQYEKEVRARNESMSSQVEVRSFHSRSKPFFIPFHSSIQQLWRWRKRVNWKTYLTNLLL